MLLTRPPKVAGASIGEPQGRQRKLSGGEELLKSFLLIHESVGPISATPLRYLTFVRTYQKVYGTKKDSIEGKRRHLQVGLVLLHVRHLQLSIGL